MSANPTADLSITKTDGVASATPGGSVTYTITAGNAGPSSVSGATVADTYPASITSASWTCVGAGGGTCPASGTGNLNESVNLPSGGSVTFTVTAAISPSATGSLSNTATVTAPQGVSDPTPGNNSAADTDALVPTADLSITKTDGVASATPGGSVTYTITAGNAGPSSVSGATVADTYPASITSASWTCVGAGGGTCPASGTGNLNESVNLPSGGSVTFTVTAAISPSATGSLSNTATVTAPQGVSDPTPGNNSAADTDALVPTADLSITKTDGVASATPGGSVTYTITAGNAGPSSVSGATVADTYPASITSASWTCAGAGGGTCPASGTGNLNESVNLPSGGSVTFTVTAAISPSATGSLSNTATVTAPQGVSDPTPGNNSAADTDALVPTADLSITKTDGVASATPGGSVTYTITAGNAGPSSVSGATVADTYPASITSASWTCAGAGGGTCPASGTGNLNESVNLPSGGSVTFTVTAAISPSATGSLSNTATVTAPQGVSDPTPGNNSAADTDALVPTADLSITKTDGVASATPGGSVTYTITAGNAGPSSVSGATVADTYPASITSASWTCVGAGGGTCPASGTGNLNESVNLPSGGSVTFTVTAAISPSATGSLSNTATVTAPQGVSDPTPGNNSAADTDALVPTADLSITKTDGVASATPGGSVTYTITAGNAGPSSVSGATVADTYPASITSASWTCVGAGGGTCPASGTGNLNESVNLPSGGSVTFTVTAAISPSATGSLSNTATVTAPQGVSDPTPGNNSAADTDALVPTADLSITKTDGVASATPGGSVTYTITAGNAGPSSVSGATVADTYPASITSASWTCAGAGGGTCPASGTGNLNESVNLPSGGSVTFTVTAAISPSATGSLSNTATVTAPQGVSDPTPGNNSAADTDALVPTADLSITKTDGVASATPGGSVTYTITAGNAGPSSVSGATVADTYPASITSASWTCVGAGGGTCPASGTGNLNESVNLPSGGSVTFTVTATVSASAVAPGSLSNTATVSVPQGTTDPNPNNNSATDTDNLVCPTIMLTTPDITNVACNGASTGSISLTASGGSGTVTYTLNPGNVQNTTGSFTNLPAGNYTVTATYPSTCATTSATITISQPSAIGISISGNTSVIYGYGSSCTTLMASASGGTPGFTYAWNNGTQGPTLNVCPTQTTTYTVTATDANQCTATRQVTVTVTDVRCGSTGSGILMCANGREICVAQYLVATYLRFGYTVGPCVRATTRNGFEPAQDAPALSLSLKAYPNPTSGLLTVEVQSLVAGLARFEVVNAQGRAVQQKSQELEAGPNEVSFELNTQSAGNYLIHCVDALGRQAVVRVNRQ